MGTIYEIKITKLGLASNEMGFKIHCHYRLIEKQGELFYLMEILLTLFRNKKVEWVPLKMSYFFIKDDDDESFRIVPKVYDGDEWPANPTPENIGFQIKK